MSFDFKLTNGDVVLESTGAPALVRNEEKLRQDLLKIILTPLGSSRRYPWYGSSINGSLIGRLLDEKLFNSEANTIIKFAINNLIRLQKDQERSGQFLTPTEALAQIVEISVERSRFDGRQYNIFVVVASRRSNVITESFTLTL